MRRIQEEFTDPLELVNPGGGDEGIDSGDEEGGQGNLSTTLTWVEREYIWSAAVGAGVDELICQVAPTGTSWATERIHYALTESTGTVVGLADTAGVAKAQYHWDPYGELLAVDLAAGVPRNRVGHQGLFMDRLDIGTQHEQLVRGADVLAQNRNRTYAPALGRFLQRDPNQSGVMTALGDRGAGLPAAALSVQGMYGDGASLYGYTRSNPVSGTDPLGLFDLSVMGLLGGASTTEELQVNWNQSVLETASAVQSTMSDYFEEAAIAQADDIEWALDWSADDEGFSRSAIRGRQQRAREAQSELAIAGRGHHIMTICNFKKAYGSWTRQYKSLLRQRGIKSSMFNLNSIQNRITDPAWLAKYHNNRGRHSQKYHQWVYGRIDRATRGKHGQDAADALTAELRRIADDLMSPGGWKRLWED